MNKTLQAAAQTATRVTLMLTTLVAAGCELSPAEPTPIDPDRPRPTLTVSPGTVATQFSSGGTHYHYQVCYSLTNPSGGAEIRVSEFDFIPIGADGSVYPASGIIGGFPHIAAGTTESRCPAFQRFFATHPAANRYRLRVVYNMFDNPSILSMEGTSTLTPGPVPFR